MKNFKKAIAFALATVLSLSVSVVPGFAEATGSGTKTDDLLKKKSVEKEFDGSFFSVTGFADTKVKDRSNYKEGDAEYKVVNNEVEFFQAIRGAKQGTVKVIELRTDLNLGWWELSEEAKLAGEGIISAFTGLESTLYTPLSNPTLLETGISDMRIADVDGLTIFSQLGNTIRHTQIVLGDTVNDFVMRNISVDEVWEWDDFTQEGFGSTGGNGSHKRVGWAPMKINGSKNVWLDHCSFGLGFDGCVDLENGAEGVSITWCKVGDTNTEVGSMIYKTVMYMEQLYQESKAQNNPKKAFTAYRIMRDNGMTLEQIMEYMAYHSKVHLCGAGDKDTWLVAEYGQDGDYVFDYTDGMKYTEKALENITSDLEKWLKDRGYKAGSDFGTIKTYPNYDKTDANELIELTLAYNQYWNVGQRVPMIRGGVGHLYNCYINDSGTQNSNNIIDTVKNASGESIYTQLRNAGCNVGKLQRTMDARNGASVAADTCVWQNVDQPVPSTQYQKDGISNMNSPYHSYFTYNYPIIVNSKVQLNGSSTVFEGNSYDNDGENPFTTIYTWHDKSVGFSWHNLALKNAYRAEKITDEAVALANYDKLTYEYQTFPLASVEEVTNKYSGFNKVTMSASDWLKTEYSSDFEVNVIDETDLAETTGIKLDKKEATVYMDESEHLQLSPTIIPANSKKNVADIKWTSSDESVAIVNDCGLVTPVKYGTVTITAAVGEFKAECKVNVNPSPAEITVANIPKTIYTGDIFDLDAVISPAGVDNTDVVWSTLTKSITLIDSSTGEFQAVKAGRNLGVNITCKFKANRVGYQHKALDYKKIKIVDADVPVTGIALDTTVLNAPIEAGNTVSLVAATIPENATNQKIYWSSSDENIVTVDENGKLTAIASGSAVIEAKTMNWGYIATCEAVVIPAKTPQVTTPPASTVTTPPASTVTTPPASTVTTPPGATTSPELNLEYQLGDANMDGKLNLQDASLVLKAALNIVTIDEKAMVYVDINRNDKVDLSDCTNILKASLNIINLKDVVVAKKLGL